MSDDWYRRTTWGKKHEEEFFARLKRSRGLYNKAQYLRIQAGYLEGDYPEESLKLLDIVIGEFPEPSELAQTYLQKARCLVYLSQKTKAIEWFRKALAQEENYPKALTQAYLDFPLFVVSEERKDLFHEAREILLKNSERLMFPGDRYRYHTALSIIEWESGNSAGAKTHALAASAAASEKNSGFRYHPKVGLVKKQDKKIQAIMKEIESS